MMIFLFVFMLELSVFISFVLLNVCCGLLLGISNLVVIMLVYVVIWVRLMGV